MKVVFVCGPTAVGKSQLALNLATEFKGAIVNCDSVQVYQSLDIGSAKPSAQEMQQVPHFLYSYVPEGAKMTAGQFSRDFFECVDKIKNQFPCIFVVGGTGFYFQALEKGMYPAKTIHTDLRKKIEDADPKELYKELQEKDPEYAAKISANDHYRLGRAMEIIWGENKTVSQVKKEFESRKNDFPYPLLKLGVHLEKAELQKKVSERTEKMLALGLLNEVRRLLDKGLGAWEALQSVGYKESLKYLSGEYKNTSELAQMIDQGTMQLIKKQKTWFRRDKDLHWLRPEEYELARLRTEQFLNLNSRQSK